MYFQAISEFFPSIPGFDKGLMLTMTEKVMSILLVLGKKEVVEQALAYMEEKVCIVDSDTISCGAIKILVLFNLFT